MAHQRRMKEQKQQALLNQLDEIDLQAIAEGTAKSLHRETLPTIMGKRMNGAKRNYRKTQPATNTIIARKREEKCGFGA